MARVIWRDIATDDLDGIAAFIADDDPRAAARIVARLHDLGESLVRSPHSGRPAGRLRELVSVRPYILRYEVIGEVVLIQSIRHSRLRPLP